MKRSEGLTHQTIEYLNEEETEALLKKFGVEVPLISSGIHALRLGESLGIQLGETDRGVSCELIETNGGGYYMHWRVIFRNGAKQYDESRPISRVLTLRASRGKNHSMRRMLIGFCTNESLYEEYKLTIDEIRMTKRIAFQVNQPQPV